MHLPFNENYLEHNLIKNDHFNYDAFVNKNLFKKFLYLRCIKCNFDIVYVMDEQYDCVYLYKFNSKFFNLDLTCNELLIKNIIE